MRSQYALHFKCCKSKVDDEVILSPRHQNIDISEYNTESEPFLYEPEMEAA